VGGAIGFLAISRHQLPQCLQFCQRECLKFVYGVKPQLFDHEPPPVTLPLPASDDCFCIAASYSVSCAAGVCTLTCTVGSTFTFTCGCAVSTGTRIAPYAVISGGSIRALCSNRSTSSRALTHNTFWVVCTCLSS